MNIELLEYIIHTLASLQHSYEQITSLTMY